MMNDCIFHKRVSLTTCPLPYMPSKRSPFRKLSVITYVFDQLAKGYQTRVRNPAFQHQKSEISGQIGAMSKRFQMVGFKGPSQEKPSSRIFRFGY